MIYVEIPTVFSASLRRTKKHGKDVEGGRCLRGRDRQLGFIEKDGAKIWNEHMEKIINKESK